MKTITRRCAYGVVFALGLWAFISLFSYWGGENGKVVTYAPISKESLTPEQLKAYESFQSIQAVAAANQAGDQALKTAQEDMERRQAAAEAGGDGTQ